MENALFKKINLGNLELKNRIFMAPLTRCRADQNHVPTPIMATYYSQRASAGLIIAEATMVTSGNSAFISEPGIYSQEQVQGWKKVTDAVHQKNGKIFLQIWHGGRACHPDLNKGQQTVAPSAIAIDGEIHTPKGKVKHVVPHALTPDEISKIVQDFEKAAQNAKAAGFDGVEIHGANGYLIDQFLRDGSNQRTDSYGGSVENRARFLLEIVDACLKVFNPNQIGVRTSPLNSFNSMKDSNPEKLTFHVAQELNKRQIGYLHLMRSDFMGIQKGNISEAAREAFKGAIVGNMGYTAQEGHDLITKGLIDAVAFGTPFISNPDLVERIEKGLDLAPSDVNTYYSPGEKGYTDYPRAT